MRFRIQFHIGFAAMLLMSGVLGGAGTARATSDVVRTEQTSAASTALAKQGRDRLSLDDWQAQAIAYSWVDISATGQLAGISGNDSTSDPISLGISFRWYGTFQTAIRVSTNGFLTFNSTANTGANTAIPNPAEPNGAFYVFWDDLMVDEAQGDWIKYLTDTTTTPDRFIVTWRCRRFGSSDTISFQAVLTADGRVTYQYQTLDIRNSSTVGMEDSAGSYGLQICYNGTGTVPLALSAYRLGEPAGTPNPVTNLTATTLGTNVLLTWTNPTTDIYGTTIGVDSCHIYQGAAFAGRVGAGVTTYAHANTQLGSVGYTVYAWNTNYRSLPTSVNVNVSTPVYNYQEDFELSNGGWTATPSTGGWEWGIPTAANGPTAHSGSKLWGTVLAGNYANSACYQLELAAGLPVAGTDAALAFWGWYKSESISATSTQDGCNFQISTNGGATWQILTPVIGAYDDTFMTVQNTCIGNRKATWNGSRPADSLVWGRWRYFVLPLSNFVGSTPVFKFTFGSDPTAANHPGFYLDDLSIWGLQAGGGATVSGIITLDGGAGDVTQTVIRANGFGALPASPNALGMYTLQHVELGQRILTATLTGYQQATLSIAVTGDLSGANLTVRREAPPAPTNLTATIEETTGVVTLNWDDSPDLYVDLYRVYRKLASDSQYVLNRVIYGRTLSSDLDTLSAAATYHYVVAAVDTNVLAPAVESSYSRRAEVTYGLLPPQSLHARADFDDHVRLTWVGPTDPPMEELSYDNGTSSPEVSGIGFSSQPLFGWIAARFQTTGAVTVHRIRIYFTGAALSGDPFQVGLFADNGSGRPTFTPLDVIDATIESPLNSFRDFYLTTPRTFASGIFYVGARQLGDWPLGIGGDIESQFVNNTFFFAADPWLWTTFEPAVMAIPMMHAVVQRAETDLAEWNASGWESTAARAETRPEAQRAPSAVPTYLTGLSTEDVARLTASRLSYATGPRAPYAEAVSVNHRDRSTLDDPDYYIVYRNGVDVAHAGGLSYDDYVSEGTTYTYWLTSHFASGLESPPSDTVTATPAMAPGPPEVAGAPLADSTMRIIWGNPTLNADGSPCVDLDSLRVYRGEMLVATVPDDVSQFIDATQYLNRLYTWSVRGVDEASNAGPAGVFSGSILPPWETAILDWADISTTGTNTGATGNDATSGPISLGFVFPFYGEHYSQVRVCTNGWLSFLSTSSTNNANVSLPVTAEPNAAIYPFWDNLNVSASSGHWVKYLNEPGRFVVTWRCQLSTGGADQFEFQVILEENGAITIQYLSLPPVTNSYTLGVENAAGTSALLLLYNGSGVWSPLISSAVQIFAPPPIFARVSGSVVFDGGNGTMTNVTVTASGANHPLVHPLADGSWTMDSVATGYRRFVASLTGFVSDTAHATVSDTGVTNLSFTLRRSNPPAPTGFVATINTATQIVTLDWNDSPDLLVDGYRVYRKPASTSTWTLVKTLIGRSSSAGSDTLIDLLGGYHYSVTAIDTNVSGSPVESNRSATATIVAGHPAPRNLTADGRFDDRIRLAWAAPGSAAALGAFDGNRPNAPGSAGTARSSKATSLTKGGKDAESELLPDVSSATWPRGRGGDRTLDEVINFRIHRDGTLLTTVAGTVFQFDDINLPENQPHTYDVRAVYDDTQESAASNVVSNARCNLAPGAPTNFTLTPWGTTMRLSWTDPTVNAQNADGATTTCTDLVKIYIYRNSVLLDSVAPSVGQYTDTPPVPTQVYTWSLRALDEVPNIGAAASSVGIVQSAWQPVSYNWVDISTTGTTIPFPSPYDDINLGPFPIGFSFTYYGQTYNSIRVCTNGWLTFSASTSTNLNNVPIPNTADPNAALYLFWDDLVVTSGWVKYLSDPTNGRFIITWNAIRYNTSDPYSQMQIILGNNGSVRYQYQSLPTLQTFCTIGLENAAGTEGIQLLAEGAAPLWTPTAQSAVEFWGGPSGSVEGSVTSFTTGAPIADCAVWATSAEENSDTVSTGIAGQYLLRAEPGSYTLHFEHQNYCPVTQDVIIESNVPLTLDMRLRAPQAQFSVTSLTIVTPAAGQDDSSATFTIRNLATGQCALDFSISDTSSWLRAAPESGILSPNQTATIRVYADVHSYPAQTELYSALVVTYHGAGTPRTIPVDVTVGPSGSAGDPATSLPTEFALRQGYPNPFNPSTQLRFDVPKESLVDIMIYNVMGQEVAHPVSSVYPAGRYGVTFDAGDLPSGMYLVRMQSGEYVGVSKLMLLR